LADNPTFIPRLLAPLIRETMEYARITAIVGPRQSGKTTLMRRIVAERQMTYTTLDDDTARRSAQEDPYGFVLALGRPAAIDEVQRVPELMLALKRFVDDDTRSGSFLVTGSANLQTLPRIADALPGRVDYLRLDPLAEAEITGVSGSVVDRLFDPAWWPATAPAAGRETYVDAVIGGGFPEARLRPTRPRQRFFEGYITSLIERDIAAAAHLRTNDRVGNTFRLVAARSGSSAEPYALGRELGLDGKTASAHLHALERLFAIRLLPAWSTNLGARITRAPRAYMADSGLHAHAIGADRDAFLHDLTGAVTGRLVETLVLNEVLRQASWAETPIRASFYRDARQREVDLVLESGRRVVGIEIKASTTANARDARHLGFLRDRLGERFVRGVVIYSGGSAVPIGERLLALPIGTLWGTD
jgi:predicted AAA+ superfamily ATPase